MLSLESSQPTSNLKARIAGAVAATCAVGVVAAVAMNNSSGVKQTTGLFNIPEDIKGHFSGGQNSGTWSVEGKFHKFETASGDWQIDSKLTMAGKGYFHPVTYTLKDNVLVREEFERDTGKRLYLECGDREEVPGYGKWADLLDNASPISRSSMSMELRSRSDKTCPEGASQTALKFEGQTWTVCADSTANTRAIYAFDETFSFQAVSRPGMIVDIELPTGSKDLNCSKFDVSIDREESFKMTLIAAGIDESEVDAGAEGRELFDDKTDPVFKEGYLTTPSRPEYAPPPSGEGRNCVFFHGVGGRGPYGGNLMAAHSNNYWNPDDESMSQGVAKHCDSYGVIDFDTFHRGYNHPDVMSEVCNALSVYNQYASRTVVFTHSMGGLYTRKVFHQRNCGWKGKYYQSQGPMDGSNAAFEPVKACAAVRALPGFVQNWLTGVTRPYCETPGGLHGSAYLTILRNQWNANGTPKKIYVSYNTAAYNPNTGRNKRSDGRLCGVSPKGYKSGPWRALDAIQASAKLEKKMICKNWVGSWFGYEWQTTINLVNAGQYTWNNWANRCNGKMKNRPWNDGMVPVSSCTAHNGTGNAPISFMSLNHGDGTGREGTASGSHRDIYQWYNDRTLML